MVRSVAQLERQIKATQTEFPVYHLSMRRSRAFLVGVYWLGAVLDAIAAAAMVWPRFGGSLFGVDATAFGPEFRYAMYMGAALMVGWTALLVWGSQEPVRRRGILFLTAVPAIAGLWGATLYAGLSDLSDLAGVGPVLVFQGVLLLLFLTAWMIARRRSTNA
jgi:hypothetical protein